MSGVSTSWCAPIVAGGLSARTHHDEGRYTNAGWLSLRLCVNLNRLEPAALFSIEQAGAGPGEYNSSFQKQPAAEAGHGRATPHASSFGGRTAALALVFEPPAISDSVGH